MKKEKKWTPHIIAATALMVFIVLGLACASTPKPPKEIVFNPSIPDDQTVTLFVSAGSFEVFEFNKIPLNPRWYDPIVTGGGTNVKIPAGSHNIRFHYYGGSGADAKNVELAFNAVAGRAYKLCGHLVNFSPYSRSQTLLFDVQEISVTKEPGPDEQLLFIKDLDWGGLTGVNVILDKGTDEERLCSLDLWNGLRIILRQGEHTIDVTSHISDLEPAGEQPRRFTIYSEPVRYSVILETTGRGTNTKTTYTLTRE